MRKATVQEITARWSTEQIMSVCGLKTPQTISGWIRRKAIPRKRLARLAFAYPRELHVDDHGVAWWLDRAAAVSMPDWMGPHLSAWNSYMLTRQRNSFAVDEQALKELLNELDLLRHSHDITSVIYQSVDREMRHFHAPL